MIVVKRNGETQKIAISKIHKAVEWACNGLEVSLSEIETNAHIQFFDGIKTAQIHTALVNSAASLIDVGKTDYEFAAARLLLQQIYKEVTQDTVYPALSTYISNAISLDKIKSEMQSFDLEALNSAIDVSRDDLFKYLGMQTVYDRYLLRDENQKLIEMPQHFWMRVAMGVALNETPESRTSWAIEFYNVLSKFEFVSSTPTLFNSGTKFSQMSSCFVTSTDDSIWEEQEGVNFGKGIFATMTECALYSKFAGGIGTDWTRVRPAGAGIGSTHGMSSGVVPYLKVFNDTAVSVNQCFDGETRIFTKSGFKAIKNIVVGDMVLGVRGDFNAVYDLRDYDQKEAMLEIDVKHSIDKLKVTDAHPIYAIQGANLETSICDTLNALEKGKLNADWIEAKNLKVGDYVAQPIPKMVCPIENFTDDDARIYGIMLGDGHITNGKNECGISLGIENKQDTISFVRSYLNARGANYWETVQNDSCIHINFSGKNKEDCKRDENGRFVNDDSFINLPFKREHLYNENGKKRIHETMMFLPESQTIALIKGLIETAGNISRGKEVTFCSTSLQLVEGLRLLLLRLECPSAANIKDVTDRTIRGVEIADTTAYSVRIPMIEKLAKALDVPALTKFNWLVHNGCVFSRIKEITSVEPSAVVYDLKVDADHSYTTSACVVHNGGKRNGSFAAYLEPWHGDIERFINLKKPNGDERLRAREIFPYIWANDLFMKRVKARAKWSLFCSHKNVELCETYGEEFERHYLAAEERGDAIKVIDAMELWKGIITALVESGAPLITFKDEHNRRNPQNHDGIIRSSNLCVTGNQRVVTGNGIFTAKELYEDGNNVVVAGVTEPSLATSMHLIAKDAEVIKINTAEGYTHDVTPDHKVFVKEKGWVEAKNLIAGDKLITQQFGMFGEVHSPQLGFLAGFIAGDGTFMSNEGRARDGVCINVWDCKTSQFIPMIENFVASVITNERIATTSTVNPKFTRDENNKRARLTSVPLARVLEREGFVKETKLQIPEFVWRGTESTVASYLSGLYLADGNVQSSSETTVIQLVSTCKMLLQDLQILWANLGVKTSICKMHDAGSRDFNDGYGEYECKEVWRILITSIQGCKIANRILKLAEYRGGKTADLFLDNLKKKGYKQKLTATFTELTALPNEDVYCLTVNSETHAWTVNGLITHNCSEISLNTSDIESAVCNLGSINVSVCTQADFPRVIPIAMRMLDNVIDLNFYPTEKARRSNLKHRPVGLGLMGWTDYIISQGIDWESDEHLRLTDFVFEDFSYWAIKSSMEIAKEKGHYSSYEGSKWSLGILPIDTARKLPDEWRHGSRDAESWDTLRTEIQQYGMRNSNCMAIAPTACVTADTLVAGQNGLLRMDEIGDVTGEQWQAIDLVVNQQSANSAASKFYCNGVHNVRTITTANGHAVTGTDSHRLKVLSSANKLEWKFLKDIAVDDLVAHRLGGYEATEIQSIITLGEQGVNSKETALPALLDKDMAVFLGAYMANGYVKYKTDGTPEGVKISLNENSVEFLDTLRNIGKAWGVYSADEQSQGVTTLCFYSVELGRLFVEELWTKPRGNNGEGAAGAFIPRKIRMSPRTIIAKFLQGLFTDGSLTFQERGSPVVEIGTVSETLASQLHALLWALGFMTKRIKSQPGSFGYRAVHRVRITNASHTVKFLGEVGWHSSEPLSKVSAYKCSERDSFRGLCVNGKKVIAEVQALRGLSKFTKTFLATAKRQGHLSFHALEKLAVEYEYVKNTLAWQLMSEGILLLPVISNAPQKEAVPTFDIEVPNEHEYVANGMVNHNTIANIVGTTPCIEPIYKQVFVKENKSGKFKVVDPAMRHNRPELCKTAFEIDQSWLIKAAAVRQKYIDQSQSVNLFKRANVKGNVISDWYFLAWELGLKSTYYLKQQISELSYEEVVKEDESPVLLCSIDNSDCEACQ